MGTVAASAGPCFFTLPPGWGVYFDSRGPGRVGLDRLLTTRRPRGGVTFTKAELEALTLTLGRITGGNPQGVGMTRWRALLRAEIKLQAALRQRDRYVPTDDL